MNQILRERISRNLEALPDERLYQVLDYIEFLGSKYARDQVRPASSSFQRFGERLEDRLRTNGVAYTAIRSTLEAMGTADRMMNGLAEAGRSLLKEVEGSARPPSPAEPRPRPQIAPPTPPAAPADSGPDRIDVDG
jgi:hypothetical protein